MTRPTPLPLEELYIVHQHDTLEKAMALIEANNHRSVVVLDDHQVVVGALSDGDVRKLLLAHRLLSTPVHQAMNLNFIALKPGEEHRAQEIFERAHIFLIPIVGEGGRLVKILTAY